MKTDPRCGLIQCGDAEGAVSRKEVREKFKAART